MPLSPNNGLYLVLDQGTSSSKIFLFTENGHIVFSSRERHHLTYPAPYHVESDPLEILNGCLNLLNLAVNKAHQLKSEIRCVGFAVQRSTFLFWDKKSGKPLTPAISWQDSRASKETEILKKHTDYIVSKTGAPLSSHFGGPKFLNLINNDPDLKKAVYSGNAWFGPLSSFLSFSFTGKPFVDESIAGRSLLVALDKPRWDPDLCDIFDVPEIALPNLVPTVFDFGNIRLDKTQIPLNCVIGDQQAALIGQGGLKQGDLAMNFGTSGSVQYNAGEKPTVTKGLLSSVLYSNHSSRYFLLEGTINACNSLFYWMENELKIPHRGMNWHDRCENVTTDGYFLPGFSGLAAPYWTEGLETVSRDVSVDNPDEYVRAGMESIGYLVYDILQAIKTTSKVRPGLKTASGGGGRKPLLQFIADLTRMPIGHSNIKDRTAMGVFHLLQHSLGLELEKSFVSCSEISNPEISLNERDRKISGWRKFLASNEVHYPF